MLEEDILIKKDKNRNRRVFLITFGLLLIISITIGVTYAFFNYTRTGGENTIETGTVVFDYQDGTAINISKQFPITESELTDANKLTFTINAHNTLTKGVMFNVYATYGDVETGKSRLMDNTMKMKFIAPANGDGFSITTNNYANATTPVFTNGDTLIASGTVIGTTGETTKEYSLYLWFDKNEAFVSSTTKRAVLAEGNPSLADATAGNTTAVRYMKNDPTDPETVTVYPAIQGESAGKIIYTTNEFSNAYYSIKIRVEAYDIR